MFAQHTIRIIVHVDFDYKQRVVAKMVLKMKREIPLDIHRISVPNDAIAHTTFDTLMEPASHFVQNFQHFHFIRIALFKPQEPTNTKHRRTIIVPGKYEQYYRYQNRSYNVVIRHFALEFSLFTSERNFIPSGTGDSHPTDVTISLVRAEERYDARIAVSPHDMVISHRDRRAPFNERIFANVESQRANCSHNVARPLHHAFQILDRIVVIGIQLGERFQLHINRRTRQKRTRSLKSYGIANNDNRPQRRDNHRNSRPTEFTGHFTDPLHTFRKFAVNIHENALFNGIDQLNSLAVPLLLKFVNFHHFLVFVNLAFCFLLNWCCGTRPSSRVSSCSSSAVLLNFERQ
nr:MAG TPA: hypothetical protein [Caudoviricetes sp.]